jgi:hypothetical protein
LRLEIKRLLCRLDGVLYRAVARHTYGETSGDPNGRQHEHYHFYQPRPGLGPFGEGEL